MTICSAIKKVVLNFSPLWFVVVLGTGSTSMLLHQLPYNVSGIRWIGIALFMLNIFIFITFLILSIWRCILRPHILHAIVGDSVQALSLPIFPMALGTLINMIVYVCVPVWGSRMVLLAWALWWLDAVIAFLTSTLLAFHIIWTQDMRLHRMKSTWLFPFLAPIVAAGSGAVTAGVLEEQSYKESTVITSYVLWSVGVIPVLTLMVIYVSSILQFKMPRREDMISLMLPVGPFGMAAFGLITLRKACDAEPKCSFGVLSGGNLAAASLLVAVPLWVCGLYWYILTLASIIRSKPPLSVGWWSTTFPTGALALATVLIGDELESNFLKVFGTVLSAASILFWLGALLGTMQMILDRTIFSTPFLADIITKNESASSDNA